MKTLLVPVERHPLIEATLETAWRLARSVDAYVEGFALTHDPLVVVSVDAFGAVSAVDPDTGAQEAQACRALFRDFMRAKGVPESTGDRPGLAFGWTEDQTATGDHFVGSYGRAFDLTVVGRPAPDGPFMGTLEAALFDSGRPILIAPPTAPATLGEHVLIAWNGSPETARTLAFARPLLERARRVTLLTVEGGESSVPSGDLVARHLRRNGIACDVRHIGSPGDAHGPAILAEAARLGCDLLVKGAYTQSRLRQMIFGGATRHIIAETTLPVFMAH